MSEAKWHDQARVMWDEKASFWHANSREMWDSGSRRTIIPFFEQQVPKGHSVLDLGCGDGYGSYKLWDKGYDVTGVDLSHEMISLCQSRLTEDMERLKFLQADMLHLPFEDQSFDSLMAINSLEWTEVPADAFKEIARVIKPGGYMVFGILGPTAGPRNHSYRRLYGEEVIFNTMMPWEFEKMIQEQGVEVVQTKGVYKQGVQNNHINQLSHELKQSLSFMWLFMLKK
ncbi:class I SAM-dependent methyltransferase [Alkalibacillus haloalkaliphilus]|uniref:class I SAM-dependent methyltransferase n=1 Tax=Alkalibacillus haloalkaliphilus TaxID=94136 RepID=UPI00030526B2|nr:class I SAM-dependent methyltransferase [Alkalibacillus haloalkaliphilus]